jgi:LCP family protein required for cell wall assembly
MPGGEKPYRVYRGGRTKGKVPLQSRPAPVRSSARDGDGKRAAKPPKRRRQTTWTAKNWIGLAVVLLLVALVAWAVGSYLAVGQGVQAANKRLDPRAKAVLAHQNGLLLSHPTNILLLGTDHANTDVRAADQHSDSIMLVRTDPGRHRITYLSIPRDLRVPIPGQADQKINAAYQIGGPALAVRTVEGFTGLKVNHLVLVDFDHFKELIDAIGGVTVDVPAPIVSNNFDCPYTQARCAHWQGWHFGKGRQHMDGRRALIYSRIRENRLNPSESDLTRAARQQDVLQAMMAKVTSPSTLAQLPFMGGDILRPISTDLSTPQFLQLGWIKFRSPAGRALHCRLGGSAANYGGQSVIVSTEENIAVIHMVTGASAPQPPPPGSGPYGPGCTTGSASLR